MTALRDWRDDPLVIIEKRLYAVAPRLMRALLPGAPARGAATIAAEASDALRHVQRRYMAPFGIEIPAEAVQACEALATRFDGAARAVAAPPSAASERAALADAIGLRLPIEVEAVMDALRAAFVQAMLDRQARAAGQAEAAAREIAQVSRQIYFISINASVEAARAGDAGRGFSIISEEIRALAQKASASLVRMRNGDGADAGDTDDDPSPPLPARASARAPAFARVAPDGTARPGE